MTSPVPNMERRDYVPYFRERDRETRRMNIQLICFALIIVISAIVFFVTTVFHLTDIAQAAEETPAQDVHSVEASCAYAGLYPEKISNLDKLQVACSDNGTPVQFTDPNWKKV